MKGVLKFIFPSDFCVCCYCLISCCLPCITLLLWHIVQVQVIKKSDKEHPAIPSGAQDQRDHSQLERYRHLHHLTICWAKGHMIRDNFDFCDIVSALIQYQWN